jgi:16S rRNA (adenine1518-N6/adenine1519-N6)-dimethyltransferase
MAQTKTEIQSLLTAADTAPRHRFGQNFMIDQNLVRTVVAAGNIAPGDVVLEVGPGTGTLTEELLASPASRVIAVEIDRDLAKMLRERFAENDRFQLIEGDALSGKHELNAELSNAIKLHRDTGLRPVLATAEDTTTSFPTEPARAGGPCHGGASVKLIANLPYNIASPLVIELLIAGVDLLAFTVQKEVADRLRAPAGGDAYGPLTVMVQMLAGVEMLRTLPPQAFWPAPKIDSALVRLTRCDQLGSSANDFTKFVHQVFSFRRKTLRKSLAMSGVDAERLLASTGLSGQKRPEEFSPAEFLAMFRAWSNPKSETRNPKE